MEQKRTFIAIILCLLIFYVWTGLYAPKKKAPAPAQIIDNKEVMKEEVSSPQLPEKLVSESPTQEKIKEELSVLSSNKIQVVFSNIGGVIKSAEILKYNTSLPLTGFLSINGFKDKRFELIKSTDSEIHYVYENEEYKIEKNYELLKDKYTIKSLIKITNKSLMSKKKDISLQLFEVKADTLDKKSGRMAGIEKSLNEYVVSTEKGIERKNKAYAYSFKDEKQILSNVLWVGFRNKYFCSIVKPLFKNDGFELNRIDQDEASFNVKLSKINLDKQESGEYSFLIFYGPETWDNLKAFNMGFAAIKKYYRFGLFDVIAKFLSELLNFSHKIIPNWGLCIILIGALTYFSMYPLTLRSMASMKKMQQLQPQLAALQKKYKADPDTMTAEAVQKNKQKLGMETMELYKKNKVNPLGGCLPMLLQMPVFIGLYQVLLRSVSFKGAHFLWIKDLSEPDRLFMLPTTLPFIGNEFNLLPIVMMILMFFQQRFSAKNMVTADPQQAAQQKMMATIFPLVFGLIFYKMPSGLTLYFTMFYTYSTFTQWKFARVK